MMTFHSGIGAEQLNHILAAGLGNYICIPAQQLHHPNNTHNGIGAGVDQ